MRRYKQPAPVLRWLMAATLLLTMGLHAVACACTPGHDCSSRASVPGATPCACAHPAESAADEPSGCCTTKQAHAPKVASASCCLTEATPPAKTDGCCTHEQHAAEADAAAASPGEHAAQWLAPAHACPCSISSAPEQNLPDRSTATLAQATPLDPRPDHAVVTVDSTLDSLATGLYLDLSHAPPALPAASTAALLCTFRC